MRSIAVLLGLVLVVCRPARAQQFNSDSWLSKPHGMATIILTYGQRTTMFMGTFSLFPKWEFTAAAYLYDLDDNFNTDDGYSTSYYAKYMFYQNKAETGGGAVKFGTGLDPGYLIDNVGLKDAFHTYWVNSPWTVPLFDNKISWDIMPGFSVTRNYGDEEGNTAWAFTYSTRVAWYYKGPTASIVGEIFGADGEAKNIPEYKLGWRWEPNQHVVLAISYGEEFDGPNGAGLEVGVMLFTPPFLKF